MPKSALRINILCRKAGKKMNVRNKKCSAKTVALLKQRQNLNVGCTKMKERYKGVTRLPKTVYVPRRAGRRV